MQFEVLFSNDYISEKDAQALLDQHDPTYSADFSQSTLDNVREANDGETSEEGPTHTYEVMKLSPHRYLCSIPILQPPAPENKTANDLAKAEEARELSRATASGWDLIAELENTCLYFMSGWWSYSFCNNREIVQFHALPQMQPGQPPKRDPQTADYVLGSKPAIPPSANYRAKQEGTEALPAELQVKGEQRYLVQRLEGGTICDLTGRDRTIEVQYHCVPGLNADRIGWIKEVTICAYLMVINTPRLCNDVAFLPPQETRANPITCQPISDSGMAPPLLDQTNPPKEEVQVEQEEKETQAEEVTIGGVVVGARHVLSGADEDGKPPVKLEPPRSYFHGQNKPDERVIKVIASGETKEMGGKVTVLNNDELDELEIDPKIINEMSTELARIAGDRAWSLELVELTVGDVRELRGYIDDDEHKDQHDTDDTDSTKGGSDDAQEEQGTRNTHDGTNDQGEEGSEEKFFKKDEL